jgi:hypothetical protein
MSPSNPILINLLGISSNDCTSTTASTASWSSKGSLYSTSDSLVRILMLMAVIKGALLDSSLLLQHLVLHESYFLDEVFVHLNLIF